MSNNNINTKIETTLIGGCPHLLPCGLCERTNRQCPKHDSGFWWNNQPTCTTSATTNPNHGDLDGDDHYENDIPQVELFLKENK